MFDFSFRYVLVYDDGTPAGKQDPDCGICFPAHSLSDVALYTTIEKATQVLECGEYEEGTGFARAHKRLTIKKLYFEIK